MKKQIIIFSISCFIFVVLIAYSVNNIFSYNIVGSSMYPTLHENEKVIGIRKRHYDRGDVICYRRNGNTTIKRIIGIPGDKVDIDENGIVYINEVPIKEEYITQKGIGEIEIDLPVTLSNDEYFILGDNRYDSFDSKNVQIGSIKEKEIESKIIFVLNPFKILLILI